MKQRIVNFSYLVSGSVVADVILAEGSSIRGEDLVGMLQQGAATMTIHEDNDVITADGEVLGTVLYSDTELDTWDFQMEGGEYESESALQPFNASRLAYAGAVAEFISLDDDMSVGEAIHILKLAGDTTPLGLAIEEGHKDKTGDELLREIALMKHGLMNLMTIAHAAGKKGQEII
jgi:hypothetical protein